MCTTQAVSRNSILCQFPFKNDGCTMCSTAWAHDIFLIPCSVHELRLLTCESPVQVPGGEQQDDSCSATPSQLMADAPAGSGLRHTQCPAMPYATRGTPSANPSNPSHLAPQHQYQWQQPRNRGAMLAWLVDISAAGANGASSTYCAGAAKPTPISSGGLSMEQAG